MKIKIVLTAHGRDTVLTASTMTAAQAIVSAFAAGIGEAPRFNPQTLRERKAAKVDYLQANAQWFAEIMGF